MATKGNHDKSVGEPSSATGRSRRATFNRFAPVADYDDQSDTGGGVNLRDFDSEGNRISTPSAKATTTGGGGAPLHGVENANPAATPISKSASSSRRNTVAPIGAGRFPGYPSSDARAQATMESDIQATINALVRFRPFTVFVLSLITFPAQGQGRRAVGRSSWHPVEIQHAPYPADWHDGKGFFMVYLGRRS